MKIAEPPKDIADSYDIRALIAIEYPESLVFQSLTSDAKEDLKICEKVPGAGFEPAKHYAEDLESPL